MEMGDRVGRPVPENALVATKEAPGAIYAYGGLPTAEFGPIGRFLHPIAQLGFGFWGGGLLTPAPPVIARSWSSVSSTGFSCFFSTSFFDLLGSLDLSDMLDSASKGMAGRSMTVMRRSLRRDNRSVGIRANKICRGH